LAATNYSELEQLYQKYGDQIAVLAYPCNQFGGQEPGTAEEIKEFAAKFNVTFDMFAKIKVNGAEADPLWKFLKEKQPGFLGNFIKWNYTKFVVDKKGNPVARFSPNTAPIPDVEKAIQKYLAK